MPQLTAFVARSFDPTVEQRIQPILDFLDTYRKAGFFWESAEPGEVESVSKKVQRLIQEKHVFIGFFTKRYPVYSFISKLSGAFQILFGTIQPQTWSTVPWVLQESGYAIAAGKHLILLREEGVEIPHLQGDLEYIPFNSENPTLVFPKLNEMINDLLAQAAGRQIIETVSEPQMQVPIEQTVATLDSSVITEQTPEPDILTNYIGMQQAIKDGDFSRMHEEWAAGSALITSGVARDVTQLTWDCDYYAARFEAGAPDGLERLRQLRLEHPDRPEPTIAIATCLNDVKEYEESACLFLEAAKLSRGNDKARHLISAANALRELKQYGKGKSTASEALSIATDDDLRTEAVGALYQLLIVSGDIHFAFATAEAALHDNPQLAIRFRLGLDYHRQGFNELALFHFRFCHQRSPRDTSSLHNLALMYSDNKLPIAAVRNYKKSAAMGETLSAVNLGFMYLDAGMTEEAKLLIQTAMQAEPHESRVDKCWAEVVQRTDDERTRETKLLDAAGEDREFLVKMGLGFKIALPPIEGVWKFPFGDMVLSVNPEGVTGSAEITREENPFGTLFVTEIYSKVAKVEKYLLKGKLTGIVCTFNLTVTEKNPQSFSLATSILGGSSTRSGIILFAADGKSAIYAETADRKIGKRENISKTGGGALT